MSDEQLPPSLWRHGIDLDGVKLALMELEPLLRAVAASGSSMLIRVDGERTTGANPRIFTVAISGPTDGPDSVRFDDADLPRAIENAITALDTRLT
jgi:hypothetical protein